MPGGASDGVAEAGKITAGNLSDYVLYVEIPDGYGFRNTCEYLKASNNKAGAFIFTPAGISYQMSNPKETAVNCIWIQGSNLSHYIYNAKQEKVIVGLSIAMLRTNTKSIGKKDGVQIFMLPDDPNLYIRQLSASSKGNSENYGFVKPQKVDDFEFEISGYSRSDDNPNCTIPVSDFSKMCASMCAIHCNSVLFKGMQRGIVCQGLLQGGLVGRVTHFGICDASSDGQLQAAKSGPRLWLMKEGGGSPTVNIQVDIEICKALAKLNNVASQSGIVKLYMEQDMPMMILCNISTYGWLRIYLKDTAAPGSK